MTQVSKQRIRNRTLVDLDKDLNQQLKVIAVQREMTKQDLLEYIVRRALEEGIPYEEDAAGG